MLIVIAKCRDIAQLNNKSRGCKGSVDDGGQIVLVIVEADIISHSNDFFNLIYT